MTQCEYDSKIATTLSRGELPDAIRAHIDQCPSCRMTFDIAHRLQTIAAAHAEEPQPTASAVWWRSSIRLRHEKLHRAEKPLIWMQRVFVAALIFLCATLIAISWRSHPSDIWGIGFLSVGAITVPIGIGLWGWSRSSS